MRIYSIFLLWISFSTFCHAQEWSDDYKKALESYDQGVLEQAFTHASVALKKYQESSGAVNENYAAILRLLSNISYSQEKYNEALGFIQKELQIREQNKDTTYAVALSNQAQFYQLLGSYERAIQSLTDCRQILSQYYQPTEAVLLEKNISIAVNYYLAGNYQKSYEWFQADGGALNNESVSDESRLEGQYYWSELSLESGKAGAAVSSFQKTKELYEKFDLQTSSNYAMVLYGLGQSQQKANQYSEAQASFRAAEEVYEKNDGDKDENYFKILNALAINLEHEGKEAEALEVQNKIKAHPEGKLAYASVLNNSASIAQGKGDFAKAEKLYLEALAQFDNKDNEAMLSYATTLQNLGMMYSDKGDQTSALAKISEARDVIDKLYGYYHKRFISVINKVGLVLTRRGNIEEARAAYNQAIQASEKMLVKPTSELILTDLGIAELERRMGNYGKADEIYQRVMTTYFPDGAHQDANYTLMLSQWAASKQTQGKLNEAKSLMQKASVFIRSHQGAATLAYGQSLENLAILNLNLGDLTSAKEDIDSSLMIYENISGRESVRYALASVSLARYHQIKGDYTKAEPYLKKARDITKASSGVQSEEYASSINSLALLYQTMGNYADAAPLLNESRTIYETKYGKVHQEYSTATQNLATLYQLEGKYDLAEPLLVEALEIDKKVLGENHPKYGILLQNLATLYQKLGKQTEAEEMLNRALQLTKSILGVENSSYATTLSNLAALYQDKSNFVKAEATWLESVELRKKILGVNHPDYARSLFGLAGVYHALGQWDKAKGYYEPVVKSYQKQVKEFFPSLSEKEKSAFYAKIKPVFDAYQDFCVQYLSANPAQRDYAIRELYDLQLSTKAILLNASNKVRTRILASGDQELKKLFNEWLTSKELMVRYLNYTQAEREQQKIDLALLETATNDLEKLLTAKSDAFKSQFEKDEIGWADVKANLKEGEAAVEILRIRKKYTKDSVYYVGLILKPSVENPEILIWPHGNGLEGRKFRYHRNTIQFHYTDTLSYRFFWLPLADKLEGVSSVFLSCDGVFNKVNFNSLFNSKTKKFVIDDYVIRQVSNTRELHEKKSAKVSTTTKASVFGFADFNLAKADVSGGSKRKGGRYGFEGEEIPILPATEKEIDEVEKILKQKSWDLDVFKQQQASEENVKSMESPSVVHFATHGFFLSDVDINENENSELVTNPLFRSGILLAGAGVERSASQNEEDGVLTAYEAMNLNLDQAELVVLSACETGLGEVRNGEGVYGLQRSFLVAGANTVLMSLWQVDDVATQELMNTFYTYWLSGEEKHTAFRKAQLAMKEKYEVPYFWGAFVLIGY